MIVDAERRRDRRTEPATSGEICVENLHKSFRGQMVLDAVNLAVTRAEVVAIVGGSGCGKTVLLEHIIGQMTPDEGRVFVANHDVTGAPLRDLSRVTEEEMDQIRSHWSIVFQRNALFSGSVYENIALWLREIQRLDEAEIRSIALAALAAVGFPSGEAILELDRDELSGGMAKRIAVARAIAMDPTIIFYDEPTTGLDPTHASQIHELIASTHVQDRPRRTARTTIIITHDKDLLRRLRPRIVMLHDCSVYFDGTFETFETTDSPIIRPYFELMPVLQRRTTVR